METFTGLCGGGPLDGKMLAHWSRQKKFYRPLVLMSLNDDAPVEAIEIGEYELDDFGRWNWHPTEAGEAYDTLFGTESTR